MRGFAIAVGIVLLSGTAMADVRDDVLDGAARCAGIADNRTWLECFYGSAQPMRELLRLPPAAPSQIRLVPPPGAAYGGAPRREAYAAPAYAPQPKPEPGFFAQMLGSTKPVVADMPLTAYRFDRGGNFIVTLANGQVWKQDESDIARPAWKKPASAYAVTIASATMGKFSLKVRGQHGEYMVHRAD